MARHRPLMATCVNMGMRLDDKANVSVLIGPASLGFPNTSSWRVALKATDNGRYDEHSSQGQISLSALQNDRSATGQTLWENIRMEHPTQNSLKPFWCS